MVVVHSCTLVLSHIQDKEYHCLAVESTESGARLQRDGGRLV